MPNNRPKVFLSATTADLGSYRLKTLGVFKLLSIEPVEQTAFSNTDGKLTQKIRDLIDECQAMIHIVGHRFGFESDQGPDGERFSYTQYERVYAKERDISVFMLFARDDCEFDNGAPDEDDALVERQARYRAELQRQRLDMPEFGNYPEFENAIFRIKWPFQFDRSHRKIWKVPHRSIGKLFIGRSGELEKLRAALSDSATHAAAIRQPPAVHGLGGIGKTRLAVEYAWAFRDEYDVAVLINAATPQALEENFANLYGALVSDAGEWEQLPRPQRLNEVLKWFNTNSKWLVIIDNVDTQEAAAAVEKHLAQLGNGHVIITARYSQWSAAVAPIEMDIWAAEDAVQFLLDRTAGRRSEQSDDLEQAQSIAEKLGYLSLAIEQAGAYIAKLRLSFKAYLQHYEDRHQQVLEWHDEQLMHYPRSVATTWTTSFDALNDSEKLWLQTLAWFATDPIPIQALESEKDEPGAVRTALAGLADLSLLKFAPDGEAVVVHRIVQTVARDTMDKPDQDESREQACKRLTQAVPNAEYDKTGWELWTDLAPHCRAVLKALKGSSQEQLSTTLASEFALWLHERMELSEAEPLMRRALAIDEASYGEDHPKVARDLNDLAQLLKDTNRLDEGEPLMRRALAIDEASLGEDHPNVARDLSNLAHLLQATNRLDEAEPLMRRALDIDEASRGEDHPMVAIRLNNLATLLQRTNRLDEAESLMRRALDIDETSSGGDHPNVARHLNNLAALLQATNRLDEAEPLMRRALAIDEASYGEDHPIVAMRLSNLASLLQATNRLDEAEPLIHRALVIDEASYGEDHPTVAIRLNNLAALLQATNRLDEAEPLGKRALEILLKFKRQTGHEHQHLCLVRDNYAAILQATGLSEADVRERLSVLLAEYGVSLGE